MVYVSDVVSAFEKALTADNAVGRSFIIAGPEICTLAEFIEKIRLASGSRRFGYRLPLTPMLYAAAVTEDVCRAIGVSPPIYRRRMDFFTSDSAFDQTRAKSELGWKPTVGLAEGIAQTLEYYMNSDNLTE
jgi:nucleoside-diphosphate-sugar epimerase